MQCVSVKSKCADDIEKKVHLPGRIVDSSWRTTTTKVFMGNN